MSAPQMELNIHNFIEQIRLQADSSLDPMIDSLQSGLENLISHSQNPQLDEESLLVVIIQGAQLLEHYPEGIDPAISAKLGDFDLDQLGQGPAPANVDLIKGALGYFLIATHSLTRIFDSAERLESDFGLPDLIERLEIAEQLDSHIRWHYAGDSKAYFEDLAQTEGDDVIERINALAQKNSGAGGGTAPAPQDPQP